MRPMFVWSLLVAVPQPASAQEKALPPVDSNTVIVIGRTKGAPVSGRVVATDDTSLTLLSLKSKRFVLPSRTVESWRVRRGTLTARGFRDTDLHTSRLFFGPTARTLERRTGYAAAYDVFIWAGAYGVSDRVMVSGGFLMMEGWDSASSKVTGAKGPAWLDARVGIIRSRKAAVALGALWGTVTGPGGGSLGNAYAVATLGSNDHAVTLMGGYPFSRKNIANEPTFMIGGETRIGSRIKLMTEVWRVPSTTATHAVWGVRWFNDRLVVHVGALDRLDSHLRAFPVAPWLDVGFRW